MAAGKDRPARPGAYGILFLLFGSVVLLSHLPWVSLPYFWDEAGYYVPAALDFWRLGAAIPRSVPPLIHPPGLSLYLGAAWSLGGFHPETTRIAMLLLAACSGLFALLLAIELLREARGMPAFLVAGMVCLSPVFFAQSLLALPDMPAMLLSTVALWLLLRERIPACALVCVALALTKETGAVAPVVFGIWLARERRWRDAAWFMLPLAALGAWVLVLLRATGHWTGSESFLQYNLLYPLHPLRVVVDAARRVYYLGLANFHWIGGFAILFAWRTSRIFHSRAWRIAGAFALAQTAAVTLLGGATLERYLLPVLPILYCAMAAGFSLFPSRPRLICSAAAIAGLAAGIWINPPYAFPYEDNLAFSDFVNLQREGADYLRRWYSGAAITAAWPMTLELSHPDLGYTTRPLHVIPLPALTPAALQALNWRETRVLAVFSRTWDPGFNPLHLGAIRNLWVFIFGYEPSASEEQIRQSVPFPASAHFERGGQWLDIYVNPTQPISTAGKSELAER